MFGFARLCGRNETMLENNWLVKIIIETFILYYLKLIIEYVKVYLNL